MQIRLKYIFLQERRRSLINKEIRSLNKEVGISSHVEYLGFILDKIRQALVEKYKSQSRSTAKSNLLDVKFGLCVGLTTHHVKTTIQ